MSDGIEFQKAKSIHMSCSRQLLVIISFLHLLPLRAAVLSDPAVFMMPLNCGELLADPAPFTNYLEAVGRGVVVKDRGLSQRIFKTLAMREKVADSFDRNRDQHPIDTLIRKTICFYREQKEPLKPVPFDDEKFLVFLAAAMPELETKVDEVVFQWESDRIQRQEYEKRVQKNQDLINKLKAEAGRQADASVRKIIKKAKSQLLEP